MNILIHITGGKHRSWQTHSLDIAILAILISYFLPNYLFNQNLLNMINREVLTLIMLAFSLGWLSHLFSDMLTSGGVRLFCFFNRKIALVPKNILGFRFKSGKDWEEGVYFIVRVFNIVLWLVSLALPFILYFSSGNYYLNMDAFEWKI